MPNADIRLSDWLPTAALIVALVTAVRIGLLAANQTDLFVDESQYWFWGQTLDFGYYSKPPLIAWIIRAATEIGSDAPFWIRVPGPICHAATALILGAIAARERAGVGIWTAALWVTLPMVTVGSQLASTDTVMMPWLALALLGWLRALETRSLGWAALAGAALGVAFLGKYAAMYYLICAGIAAIWRIGRPNLVMAAAALAAFAIAISPNIVWNLANGLSTVEHTLDNADWVRDPGARASLNGAGLAEFFASQFIVFGPVLFVGLIWVTLRGPRALYLVFSLPILALVCGQALLSQAYANWAAAAYLAGLLAVVPWLIARPLWLWGTVVLHTGFALFLPVATAVGTGWTAGPEDRLLLARYLGRTEMSGQLLSLAETEALPVVADDRDVLADLFYVARDASHDIYARPVSGRPPNHYVQTQSLPSHVTGQVLLVTKKKQAPQVCTGAADVTTIAPATGAYRDRPQRVYRVDAACLRP